MCRLLFQAQIEEILPLKAGDKVIFGKDTENKVADIIKGFGGKKILIHYGTGSIIRTGLLKGVTDILDKEGISYISLGGAVPNLRLTLVYKRIKSYKFD